STITIYRTEISLADDKRISHRKILRHLDHCVVHRSISVRMVFTEHITDDRRGFARLGRYREPRFLHRKKNAAVHRLEPITYIRQSTSGNDRHRVVEIRLTHLSR